MDDGSFRVLTMERMNQTMTRLQKFSDSEYTPFIRVLFGVSSPTPVPVDLKDLEERIGPVDFVDSTLNDSQKDAIRFALASGEVALIHGPPGVKARETLVHRGSQLMDADRQDAHTD